jgi:RND family efflux transporter MFP subunit
LIDEGKKEFRMKRKVLLLVVLLVVVFLALAVLKGRRRLASAPRWQPRPVPVTVGPVRRATIRRTISYLARLEPSATAEVAPRVSARVEKLLVDKGDSVQAGQLMAKLDDRDIKAQISALEAKIAAQDARLKGNRAALEAAGRNVSFLGREFERYQGLFNEKATSASVLESSRDKLDTARGKLEGLEQEEVSITQERKALAAQLEEVRTHLSYTEIRSPFAGVVRLRYLEVGDTAKAGGAIFSLMNYACHRLVFDLVQEDLGRVAEGQTVLIRWPERAEASASQSESAQATLSRIFPSLEAGKTVRAEVDLHRRLPEGLRIGSFLPVEIVVEEAEGPAVPRGAVVPVNGGGSAVYVVRSGSLELVPVREVLSDERHTLIEGDVKDGEQVAVDEYLQWVRRSRGQRVEVSR